MKTNKKDVTDDYPRKRKIYFSMVLGTGKMLNADVKAMAEQIAKEIRQSRYYGRTMKVHVVAIEDADGQH